MAKFTIAVQRTVVERMVFDIEAETETEACNTAFAQAVARVKNKKGGWEDVRNFVETLILENQ